MRPKHATLDLSQSSCIRSEKKAEDKWPKSTAQKAGGPLAVEPTEIPGHGTFAIYVQGGVDHGLWEKWGAGCRGCASLIAVYAKLEQLVQDNANEVQYSQHLIFVCRCVRRHA